MIHHSECRLTDMATYQNKDENCSLTISNDFEITFSSSPPAGMKANQPRQLEQISNSNYYIIAGTAAILALLPHNRIKIIE